MNGVWRVGPGIELFQALQAQLGEVPILAEDLGIITTDVVKLRWEWVTTVRRAQHTCAPPPYVFVCLLLVLFCVWCLKCCAQPGPVSTSARAHFGLCTCAGGEVGTTCMQCWLSMPCCSPVT